MGKLTPDKGVFKRKGSDVWQHRVFIPSDVRSCYGGKSELPAKSLGTRGLREANSLARERQAEFEREFAEKRALLNGASVPSGISDHPTAKQRLTPAKTDRLVAAFRQSLIDRDFDERLEVFAKAEADPEAFWACKILPRPRDKKYLGNGQPVSYWDRLCDIEETPLTTGVVYALQAQRKLRLERVKDELRLGQTARLVQEAESLLGGYQFDQPSRRAFLRRLMQTEAAVLAELINEQVAEQPFLADDCVPAAEGQENPLLSVAAKAWIKEKSRLKLTARRIEECEAAIALFIEIASDRPVANYQKSDVRDFKEILLMLPPNRNKKRETRNLGARAAAKEAERLNMTPMAVKTVNAKYLAPLGNFFEFAIGSYGAIQGNPFQNAALPEQNSPRDEWNPFDVEDLKIFFNAPLYRGCKSAKLWMQPGRKVPRDSARFWLPLLLLYTGARVNEICKLRVKDVGQEQGIRFLNIEWEKDDGTIAGRVKNASSERLVPIHADLVSFGFLDFVEGVRAAKYERLFHELKPNKYGKLYGTISQRFSDTFKGTLARYGDGKTDLEILAGEIKKLKFKGLDLSHLRTPAGPVRTSPTPKRRKSAASRDRSKMIPNKPLEKNESPETEQQIPRS